MLCGAQNDSGRIGLKRVQPESLYLLHLLGGGPGRLILIVIIETKQREDLIDGLYQLRVGGFQCLSWPRWCR